MALVELVVDTLHVTAWQPGDDRERKTHFTSPKFVRSGEGRKRVARSQR